MNHQTRQVATDEAQAHLADDEALDVAALEQTNVITAPVTPEAAKLDKARLRLSTEVAARVAEVDAIGTTLDQKEAGLGLAEKLSTASLLNAEGSPDTYRGKPSAINAPAVQEYVRRQEEIAEALQHHCNSEAQGKSVALRGERILEYQNGKFIVRDAHDASQKEIARISLSDGDLSDKLLSLLYRIGVTDAQRDLDSAAEGEDPSLQAAAKKLSVLRTYSRLAHLVLTTKALPKVETKAPAEKFRKTTRTGELAKLAGGVALALGVTLGFNELANLGQPGEESTPSFRKKAVGAYLQPEYNEAAYAKVKPDIEAFLNAGRDIKTILEHFNHQYEAEIALIDLLEIRGGGVALSYFKHEASQLMAINLIRVAQDPQHSASVLEKSYAYALTPKVKHALDVFWQEKAVRNSNILHALLKTRSLPTEDVKSLITNARSVLPETVLDLPEGELQTLALEKCKAVPIIDDYEGHRKYKGMNKLLQEKETRKATAAYLAQLPSGSMIENRMVNGYEKAVTLQFLNPWVEEIESAMDVETQRELLEVTTTIDHNNVGLFQRLLTPELQVEYLEKLSSGLHYRQIAFLWGHVEYLEKLSSGLHYGQIAFLWGHAHSVTVKQAIKNRIEFKTPVSNEAITKFKRLYDYNQQIKYIESLPPGLTQEQIASLREHASSREVINAINKRIEARASL